MPRERVAPQPSRPSAHGVQECQARAADVDVEHGEGDHVARCVDGRVELLAPRLETDGKFEVAPIRVGAAEVAQELVERRALLRGDRELMARDAKRLGVADVRAQRLPGATTVILGPVIRKPEHRASAARRAALHRAPDGPPWRRGGQRQIEAAKPPDGPKATPDGVPAASGREEQTAPLTGAAQGIELPHRRAQRLEVLARVPGSGANRGGLTPRAAGVEAGLAYCNGIDAWSEDEDKRGARQQRAMSSRLIGRPSTTACTWSCPRRPPP